VRCEGLSRVAGTFVQSDGALEIVTQALGPGSIRGDRYAVNGVVDAGAHAIVRPQTAARALGPGLSRSESGWGVGSAGALELLNEPLVLFDEAAHEAVTIVDLASTARCVICEIVVCAERETAIHMRSLVRSGDRVLAYDAYRLRTQEANHRVVGSFLACGGRWNASLQSDADEVVQRAIDAAGAPQAALGRPRYGGVFVRALGMRAWEMRELFRELATSLRVIGYVQR